jgi:hypothetical protein
MDSSKAFLFPTSATTVQPLSYIDFGVNAWVDGAHSSSSSYSSLPIQFLPFSSSSSNPPHMKRKRRRRITTATTSSVSQITRPISPTAFPPLWPIDTVNRWPSNFPLHFPPSSSHSAILQRFIGLKCWPRNYWA